MQKTFAHFVLKLFDWSLEVQLPREKKFILIGAPHTSNWDLPLALLTFWTLDVKIHWLAKIQMFRGPLHYLFTVLGGIPIDRSTSHGFINQITNKFNQVEEMVLTIAPEGTRSKTDYWKSGFYHIALTAKVPVCFGYIDYSTRTLGFKQIMYPSGNIEADMKIISDFYRNIKGKHPEKQGPVRIRNR
jgi:1-acyl-sn-glycerol-3-phosphate acyltransferase